MKPHTLRSWVVSSAFALASCGSPAPQPDSMHLPHMFIEGIALSYQEQQKLIPLANAGDADAASRLAHHFLLAMNDEKQGLYWLKQAAMHGGKREKESYKSYFERDK